MRRRRARVGALIRQRRRVRMASDGRTRGRRKTRALGGRVWCARRHGRSRTKASAAAASLHRKQRRQDRAEAQVALEEGATEAPDEHRSEGHARSRALARGPGCGRQQAGCARRPKDLGERRVRADRRGRQPLVNKIVGAQLAQARVEEGGVHQQKVSQTGTELAARKRGQGVGRDGGSRATRAGRGRGRGGRFSGRCRGKGGSGDGGGDGSGGGTSRRSPKNKSGDRRRDQRLKKRSVQRQQGAHVDVARQRLEQVALARSLIAASVLGKGERDVKKAQGQAKRRELQPERIQSSAGEEERHSRGGG